MKSGANRDRKDISSGKTILNELGSIFVESTVGFAALLAMITWTVNLGATIWETSLFLDTSRAAARADVFDCAGYGGSGLINSVSFGNKSTKNKGNWNVGESSYTSYSYGSYYYSGGPEGEGIPGGSGSLFNFSQPSSPPPGGIGLAFKVVGIQSTAGYCRLCSGYFSKFTNITINTKALFPRSNSCS